jgi:hypothetical protein
MAAVGVHNSAARRDAMSAGRRRHAGLECATNVRRQRIASSGQALSVGLLVIAVSVAGLGGVASAASTGNSQTFTDPTGDNQKVSSTNYAADIRSLTVTSTNKGVVHFATTLADAGAKLRPGDQFRILLNVDRNTSTGDPNGVDLNLASAGSASGTVFKLCRFGHISGQACDAGPTDWAHDKPIGRGLHVVDFTITMGVCAFDFRVVETYTRPGGSTILGDWLPDSPGGKVFLSYNLKADPDRDRLCGSADNCVNVRAGKFDRNHNGCPGPYRFIRVEPHFNGIAHPTYLQLNALSVSGTPAGARVVFSSRKGTDTVQANSAGVARAKRVKGAFRYGSVIKIRITKPGYVGSLLKLVVAKRGLRVRRGTCIPANGGAPLKCSARLAGR